MSQFSFTGKVGETVSLVFDFTEELQYSRRSNYQYSLTDYVTIGAFVYECTNAGKTDYEQPDDITTTIGQPFTDGSVEWTCRDYGLLGTDTIASQVVTPGTGITVDSTAVQESVRVRVEITLVTQGPIDLTSEVTTSAGEVLKERITVVVLA